MPRRVGASSREFVRDVKSDLAQRGIKLPATAYKPLSKVGFDFYVRLNDSERSLVVETMSDSVIEHLQRYQISKLINFSIHSLTPRDQKKLILMMTRATIEAGIYLNGYFISTEQDDTARIMSESCPFCPDD